MSPTTTAAATFCEVAIIGGGVLGLASAALLAGRGYRVCLFRLSNDGLPRADTLRNQGWLQSGLMYCGKMRPDVARRRGRVFSYRMYLAGRDMLTALELPVGNEHDPGIFRIHEGADSVANFLGDADALGLSNLVRELSPDEARFRLGAFYEHGHHHYYTVPDAPFPEARVLEVLREEATTSGVQFVECSAPVALKVAQDSPSGHAIVWDDKKCISRATVLAAGVGSYELLRGIDIEPRMKLQQTPLLVIKGCHRIEAPIFADRPRGFSVVRHGPDGSDFPDGAMVIGTADAVYKGAPFLPYDRRKIDEVYIERFREQLPDFIKPHVDSGRFTCGYEPVPDGVRDPDGNELQYFEPWVEWVGAGRGVRLLLATPGRATMGVDTAVTVFDFIEDLIGAPDSPPPGAAPLAGAPWDGRIFMHFHPNYRFDDRRR